MYAIRVESLECPSFQSFWGVKDYFRITQNYSGNCFRNSLFLADWLPLHQGGPNVWSAQLSASFFIRGVPDPAWRSRGFEAHEGLAIQPLVSASWGLEPNPLSGAIAGREARTMVRGQQNDNLVESSLLLSDLCRFFPCLRETVGCHRLPQRTAGFHRKQSTENRRFSQESAGKHKNLRCSSPQLGGHEQ